ncbi:adenylate/guanylate cyclase domain-containing protein [Spirulina sp. CS-785/01]|uniref:adenylate/guanylate cyclase domain-containing protein n=1 Tax=Spirulina sp. CS-785/01 TaxID=3021716 RepID=UPI00232D438A|nr:adenylate/guanylate cyclase domain-containing protein [Spirulina sp. CS-785/01]MDB9312110.1 adenylate/guanylate cyclase domain-containing protein [Spirulina sp. CS-785/01]
MSKFYRADGIIVFFGAPTQRPDDGDRAIACAVAMQLAMEEVNQNLKTQGFPPLKMGIGIDTGEVVVGNVGSQKRAKWTVVGYHVNLAARIESFTAGNQILVSWDTLRTAQAEVQVEQQRMVKPKGFKDPMNIYEVQGIGGKYNLFLSSKDELIRLKTPIEIGFALVVEKEVTEQKFLGYFVELSTNSAVVESGQSVEPLSNVQIALPDYEEAEDLYAKVLRVEGKRFFVRFTLVSPRVEELLFQLVKSS